MQNLSGVISKNKFFIFASLLFLFPGITAAGGLEMKLTSPTFEHHASIPREFSCQGKGANPALSIEGTPKETKSLALIVDDPDAPGGDFVHWVVFDIPVTSRIDENSVPGKQGASSLGRPGYVSPCPPTGAHHYFFKIYALDTILNLKGNITKQDLESAMQGHILQKAELIGLYQKK